MTDTPNAATFPSDGDGGYPASGNGNAPAARPEQGSQLARARNGEANASGCRTRVLPDTDSDDTTLWDDMRTWGPRLWAWWRAVWSLQLFGEQPPSPRELVARTKNARVVRRGSWLGPALWTYTCVVAIPISLACYLLAWVAQRHERTAIAVVLALVLHYLA